MSIIIDLLGSAVIAGLLILMLITFQTQLRDTAQRALFTANMLDHMDQACTKINQTIALAGVGMEVDSTIVTAESSRLIFRTYWDYQQNKLSDTIHSVLIKVATTGNQWGKNLVIMQDGVNMNDTNHILYISAVGFVYYDKDDIVTTDVRNVRSVEALLTFRQATPSGRGSDVVSLIQIKCFLMNSYLKGA